MAIVTKITTLAEMKNYVLRKLGYPVNNIEISDDQLEDAINDTVMDFQRYNYDEGTYLDYFMFQTSAGVSDYPISSVYDYKTSAVLENVQHVWDFSVAFGMDGINTMFSPTHILLYNQYVEQGSYPGGPAYGSPNALVLSDYQTSMMYLEEINNMFGKGYYVNYIPATETLRVTPTPNMALVGVLIFYRKAYAYQLYNNPLVKKLAVAKAGIRWGRNLSKYSGQLPDGLTINASEIIQEYKEEEEKVLEQLFSESEPPDFFIM
jgi:hypothetical protein